MEEIAKHGHTVFVVLNSYFDYKPIYIKKIGVPIKYVRHRFPPASYLFKKNLQKYLSKIKQYISSYNVTPEFIHIHGDTHLKAALFLRKKLRLPLFYAFRCNDIDRAHILRKSKTLTISEYLFSVIYEPVNRYREKQVAQFAELITFQNRADTEVFLKRTGSDRKKTVIIPGNIGLPRCTPDWKDKNKSQNVKKILYIGSLDPSKGILDLLKSMKILITKGFSFLQCYILGRTENMETTLALIHKLDIIQNIHIEGFTSPFPYLADCDLMIYPTLYDAFPDTVLEALHIGCPVIASSVGGLPDLLVYPELLFKSGNISEIADKIELCITDTAFYHKIREFCSQRSNAYHFDWAEQFEKAMKDYQQFKEQ
jgi:glycosyltransferase involved in cell wall biosynthesis